MRPLAEQLRAWELVDGSSTMFCYPKVEIPENATKTRAQQLAELRAESGYYD